MNTQSVSLKLLFEAAWNANRVSRSNMERLRSSFERFGVVENLVARPHPERPGCFEVLSGNHRLRLLREFGHREAPVVVVDLDDAQARLFADVEPDARQRRPARLRGAVGASACRSGRRRGGSALPALGAALSSHALHDCQRSIALRPDWCGPAATAVSDMSLSFRDGVSVHRRALAQPKALTSGKACPPPDLDVACLHSWRRIRGVRRRRAHHQAWGEDFLSARCAREARSGRAARGRRRR
jgi:hypothetical protein